MYRKYNVPPATILYRLHGGTSICEAHKKSQKFDVDEEEVIVQHLQGLDTMLKVLDIGSFNEFVTKHNSRVLKQVKYVSPRWYVKFLRRYGDRVCLRNGGPSPSIQ